MPAPAPAATCHVDRSRRTAIVISRTKSQVQFVRLGTEDGYLKPFSVESADAKAFDGEWKLLPDYPAEKAARLYAGYAREIGATEEAMHALAQLTKVTQEDITMATTKQATAPVKTPAKKANVAQTNEEGTRKAGLRTGTKKEDLPANGKAKEPKAAPVKKADKPVKTTAAKTAAAKTEKPAVKGKAAAKPAPSAKGETAADLFRDLIRAGKLTDDEIFKQVQVKFKLADNKRSYVSWYRNSLLKAGEKVPAAKK